MLQDSRQGPAQLEAVSGRPLKFDHVSPTQFEEPVARKQSETERVDDVLGLPSRRAHAVAPVRPHIERAQPHERQLDEQLGGVERARLLCGQQLRGNVTADRKKMRLCDLLPLNLTLRVAADSRSTGFLQWRRSRRPMKISRGRGDG